MPTAASKSTRAKLRTPSDAARRSVYLFARRNYQLTELGVFDQPVVATNCTCRHEFGRRFAVAGPLNGRFAFDQARLFAERVERTAGTDASKQIETAFRIAPRPIAFGRRNTTRRHAPPGTGGTTHSRCQTVTRRPPRQPMLALDRSVPDDF